MTESLVEADPATVIRLRWELRLFGCYGPVRNPAAPESVAAGYLIYAREVYARPVDGGGGGLMIYPADPDPAVDPGIARAERLFLLDLATGGPITVPQRNQRSREFRLTSETLAAALDRLTADRLIRVDEAGTITARYPTEAPTIREWPMDLSSRWINPRPGSTTSVGRVDRTAPAPIGLPLAEPLADLGDASAVAGGGIGGLSANGSPGEISADLRGRSAAHPVDRRPADSGRAEKPSTGERSGGSTAPSSASSPTDHPRSTGADVPVCAAVDPVLHRTIRAILTALVSTGTPLPRSTIRNRWLSGPQKKRLAEALDLLVAAGVVVQSRQVRATVYFVHYRYKARAVELDLDQLAAEVVSTAAGVEGS